MVHYLIAAGCFAIALAFFAMFVMAVVESVRDVRAEREWRERMAFLEDQSRRKGHSASRGRWV